MNKKSPLSLKEQEQLEWCLSILEEENIQECQDEAEEIAYKEAYGPRAYEELLPLLVKLRVHELTEHKE